MKINYPKVQTDNNQKVFVSFLVKNKLYRLYNGKRIGNDINPNSFPIEERLTIGNLLAAEVYNYISGGGLLTAYRTPEVINGVKSDRVCLKDALHAKLKGNYSEKYKSTLRHIYTAITNVMSGDSLTSHHINLYLERYSSGTSYNTTRRHLNVLVNEAVKQGMTHNPATGIKSVKAKAKLNKPFNNISETLKEVSDFNHKLHLCCLLTYGCLLRPHREIRELTWGDFSDDLTYISLSGLRNKSGRNRVVPVPSYIRDILVIGERNHNIFTGTDKALNEDYFKTLWSRFKKQTTILEEGQTLYSFRHSGAIDIFKRTGSLTKLQKAMGHSSLNVSLTYLRGLEVSELEEGDMPMI
ncbi:MAG: site-specific integrase [Polaribacter sp.]|nr:site-specific integrase [Polaribacter sp.]